MKRIYLDHAATTPLDPEVAGLMHRIQVQDFGNPSSIYAEGRKARMIVENARKTVARLIGASTGEVFFTSGGTEANNTLIKNSVRDLGIRRIISSPTEHPGVLNSLRAVARDYGTEIVLLPVNHAGQIALDELEAQLRNEAGPTLVSLMYVNNELGTIHPIKEIGRLAHQYGALFHTDAVQALGLFPVDVAAMEIDFLSCSAHKFNGPKAAGFMYISSRHRLRPFLDGGAQERNMRAGTESPALCAGLARAFEKAVDERAKRLDAIQQLRAQLLDGIRHHTDIRPVGDDTVAVHPKIVALSLPLTPKTEAIVFNLDINGIAASAGSACSSGAEKASPTLEAIGMAEDRKLLRVSLSHLNTADEIERFLRVLLQNI